MITKEDIETFYNIDFELNQNVQIVNVNSMLNGRTGKYLGKASEFTHMVLLDVPTETHLAVVIPTTCLIKL